MIWEDRNGFLDVLKDKKRFGVFLDMGVGKTSLLLALIDQKIFEGAKKILIIAPKIVSLSTWQDEIAKWDNFSYLSNILTLIDGDEKQRIKLLQQTGDFCVHIVSSSITEWMTGKYEEVEIKPKKPPLNGKLKKKKVFCPNQYAPVYDMIIVDECSQFKNTRSNRFNALKKLTSYNNHLFLLSGTPFPNVKEEKDKYYGSYRKNADELYYAFYLLGIFKGTLTDFRNTFCFVKPWQKYHYLMPDETYKKMQEVLNDYCIRKKLELNIPLIEEVVVCKSDQKRFNVLKKQFIVETKGFQKVTANGIATMINKALQLANGFVYDEFKNTHRINNFKFEALLDVLSRTEGNAIIFYIFAEDKEFLLQNLPGSRLCTDAQDKKDWNDGKIKYLIMSPASRFGLNLQKGGNTIVWFGIPWSAEAIEQGNRRLYRPDQKASEVRIYYLLAEGTYDFYVYDVVVRKIASIDEFRSYNEKLAE